MARPAIAVKESTLSMSLRQGEEPSGGRSSAQPELLVAGAGQAENSAMGSASADSLLWRPPRRRSDLVNQTVSSAAVETRPDPNCTDLLDSAEIGRSPGG